MAKSGFWLRGARGKLAGGVLQKGENGTVIREHVVPANPQSDEQMYQRVAFATVVQAAKYMLPIIGQTFEGMPNEKENRREFVRRNVNQLKNIFKEGYYDGWGTAKGISALIPNEYIISDGTLIKNYVGESSGGDIYFHIANADNNKVTFDNGSHSVIDLWRSFFHLDYGEQLTVCILWAYNENPLYVAPEHEGENYQISQTFIKAYRIVLYEHSSATINIGSGLVGNAVWAAMMQCVDTSKSDPQILNYLKANCTVFVGNDTTEITMRTLNSTDMEEAFNGIDNSSGGSYPPFIQAMGLIWSKLVDGEWKYSSGKLVCGHMSDDWDAQARIAGGLKYKYAYPTFVKPYVVNSNLFTRQGGDSNQI